MKKYRINKQALQARPLSVAVALALASMNPGLAWAEQADKAPPAPDSGARLESVVVTANKRLQNLQDVPAAISVLNDTILQNNNVRDMNDLPALSPALTVTYAAQPGSFSLNMRGIGTYSLGVGVEADVSVIIDDVPLGIQASAFKDLADVHRIEVLKGPQSTLHGKSSIAGAVSITTKPIESTWRTRTSTLLSNDGEWRLGASTSGALSDTVRMRLAASKTSFGGVVRNLTTGERMNGSRNQTFVGKLEWTPSENFEVVFSPYANRSNINCCVPVFTSMTPGGLYQNIPQLPNSELLRGIDVRPGNVDIRQDYPAGGNSRSGGAGLKMQYTFGEESPLAKHVLSSITSYASYRMNDWQDLDGTEGDYMRYVLVNGKPSGFTGSLYQHGMFDVESRTQELRLTSPDSGDVRYLIGLWYGDNRLQRELTKAPAGPNASWYHARARNTNYAVFGQSSWEFRKGTSLITGLRLNREDSGFRYTRFMPPPNFDRIETERFSGDNREHAATGKIGLQHQLNRDTMLYGLFSTGRKGVGYDLISTLTAEVAKTQPVPAETAKNYELGAKLGLLDGKAMLNLAVFRTDFKGFQQSASFLDPNGFFRAQLHSIGGLRTSGLEADGSWRVSRALTFNGAFAYTRAIVTEFENGPCYAVLNEAGTGRVSHSSCVRNPKFGNNAVANLKGKPLPNAPKVKVVSSG
ncbi:MAG: TonB-dependent receptor [Telluria sp.]